MRNMGRLTTEENQKSCSRRRKNLSKKYAGGEGESSPEDGGNRDFLAWKKKEGKALIS